MLALILQRHADPDTHRIEPVFQMVDVRGDNQAAGRDFIPDEFRRALFFFRDALHLAE